MNKPLPSLTHPVLDQSRALRARAAVQLVLKTTP